MTNESFNEQLSPMVDEAIIQGAQPFEAPHTETLRIPHPTVPYAYYEATGFNLNVNDISQRANNAFAMMRTVAGSPMPQNQTPPQAAQPPQAPQMAQGNAYGQPIQGQRGRQSHPEDGVYTCPEHGVAMLKTAAQYDDSGDKFYHPLPPEQHYQNERGMTVKNCNKWRSMLAPVGGA